jgi:hypothetical protein
MSIGIRRTELMETSTSMTYSAFPIRKALREEF